MATNLHAWRLIGLAMLLLALAVAPLRVWAAPAAADPCHAAAVHHDCDPGLMNADCLMVCAAALPAREPAAAVTPASYVLRFQNGDVILQGITHHPEPPPPR